MLSINLSIAIKQLFSHRHLSRSGYDLLQQNNGSERHDPTPEENIKAELPCQDTARDPWLPDPNQEQRQSALL